MDIVLLVIRLLLAAVFGVAALAKLADRDGAQEALKDFGVPPALVPSFAVLLPLAEVAIAMALLLVATAWWGAVAASVLLLLFIAGLGMALARGRRPDCHCFGQLSSAPIGWSTLGRNMVLVVAAAFVVWKGPEQVGPSVISWMADLTPAEAVGIIIGVSVIGLLVVDGWLLVHLLRQNGRLLLRIEALEARSPSRSIALVTDQHGAAVQSALGLPIGAPAPDFSLPTLGSETLSLSALRALGKPIMLVFSDPSCGPCTALMPEIGEWQRDHAAELTVAVVSRGAPEANRAKSEEHVLSHVLLQNDFEVAANYQVHGTPSAVIVWPDATIGSPVAVGPASIVSLFVKALGQPVLSASSRTQRLESSSRVRRVGAILASVVALAAGAAAAGAAADPIPGSELYMHVSRQTALTLANAPR